MKDGRYYGYRAPNKQAIPEAMTKAGALTDIFRIVVHGLPNGSIHESHDMTSLQSWIVHPPTRRRSTFANVIEDGFRIGLRSEGGAV